MKQFKKFIIIMLCILIFISSPVFAGNIKKPKGYKLTSYITSDGSVKTNLKWKKVKGVKGYKIQYKTVDTTTGIKGYIYTKKNMKKVDAGAPAGMHLMKYKYRVQAYRVVNGKKVSSSYTKWKKFKTTKKLKDKFYRIKGFNLYLI